MARARRSLLSSITIIMALVSISFLFMVGLFLYASYQIRLAVQPAMEADVPISISALVIKNKLRAMQLNASEYVLGEEEEYSEYIDHYERLSEALQDLRNTQSKEAIKELGLSLRSFEHRTQILHSLYIDQIFKTYSPAAEKEAADLAHRAVKDLVLPLEEHLNRLAEDEFNDTQASSIEDLISDDIPGIKAYMRLIDEAGDMHSAMTRYLLQDPESKNNFYNHAFEFERLIAHLKTIEQKPQEQIEIKEIERLFNLLLSEGDRMFTLYNPRQKVSALESLDEIEHTKFAELEKEIVDTVDNARVTLSSRILALNDHSRINLFTSLFTALIGLTFIAAIIWYVRYHLYHPLLTLTDSVERLRQGDRDLSLAYNNDELGDVFASLEEFQSDLLQLDVLREKERFAQEELVEERDKLSAALNELSDAQGKLVQSEKMASLGSLVAGVSHEINTPLGVAVTLGSNFEQTLKEFFAKLREGKLRKSDLEGFEEDSLQGLTVMQSSLDKAAQLIHGFKQVAMDQSSQTRREFSVSVVMDEIMLTVHHQIKRTNIQCDVECPTEIIMDSFPGPFGQVITNLFNNALLHGLDGAEEGEINFHASLLPDDQVLITCTDSGQGIPPENISKIFDPFFTTKLGKGGSGLGLNIVYNIVTTVLGGEIKVENVEGKGAKFTLTLPLTAPKQDKEVTNV